MTFGNNWKSSVAWLWLYKSQASWSANSIYFPPQNRLSGLLRWSSWIYLKELNEEIILIFSTPLDHNPLVLFDSHDAPVQWWRKIVEYPIPEVSPGFFRRGRPWPLKGYQALPAGGPGAKAPPPTVAKFHFLKRFKVLEHESISQNFFLPKKSIYSTKTFEKWSRFYKNFWNFSKNVFKIFNF